MNRDSAILLGVCATDKKMKSRPMREILGRIRRKEIKIIEMSEYLPLDWNVNLMKLRPGPQ